MIREQDVKIDGIIGIVKATGYEGQDMKTELNTQMPMLKKLDKDI